jgi:predicted  nucleic acid-binding Zn-ribbon protein
MNLSIETLQHLRENRDCARKLIDEIEDYLDTLEVNDSYWVKNLRAAQREFMRLDYQIRTLEERRMKVLYSRQEGYYHA